MVSNFIGTASVPAPGSAATAAAKESAAVKDKGIGTATTGQGVAIKGTGVDGIITRIADNRARHTVVTAKVEAHFSSEHKAR